MRVGGEMIQVVPGPEALSRSAARVVVRQARQSLKARGLFTLSLSGGSTPLGLYGLLAHDPSIRAQLDWGKIHFFWGDERHVPPDHRDSNYRLAKEALLSEVPVPAENIHRIRSENSDAQKAAQEYEQTLRHFFHLGEGEFPRVDLVLLGMGTDGHTAYLFPGTEALFERRRLVVANWVKKYEAYRITLTLPVFNRAAFVLFLVTGEEKAETLHLVLEGKGEEEPFPVQFIRPSQGRLLWLVDQGAAHRLQRLTNKDREEKP